MEIVSIRLDVSNRHGFQCIFPISLKADGGGRVGDGLFQGRIGMADEHKLVQKRDADECLLQPMKMASASVRWTVESQ